jgi:hypothetical protein
VAATAVAFALMAVAGVGVLAPRAAAADLVKYYEVAASYTGHPENLSEIALRFLGSGARAGEIFNLNVGRTQPDGAELTDANTLHKGWFLILPWDAVGDGVHYGELPTKQPQRPTTPTRPAVSYPPTGAPSSVATRTASGPCAPALQSKADAEPWAQLRLAPQQAWTRSRGDGVTVAVVDSGVDASVPQLAGRVAVGADVVTGSGRGDTDCLGSGTAMACLIAADGNGSVMGMAPAARILPVRMVTDKPPASVADQASAIDVAVSAGAHVLALGSFVDTGQPQVQQAVSDAANHGVIVVVGASTGTGTAAKPADRVIRVGAMGIDGHLAQAYTPGGVDVVAPGVDVRSIGLTGTGSFRASGTQYAVAFVAGEVALLRGMYKNMSPDDLTHLVMHSASPMSQGAVPDPASGWGLIDLGRAVTLAAPAPVTTRAAARQRTGVPTGLLVVVVVVALVTAALLVLRIRRAIRSVPGADEESVTGPPQDPPVPDRPPGLPSTTGYGGQPAASGALPRRTPAPRPTMASDIASSPVDGRIAR